MSILQLPLPIAANTGVVPNIKTMTVTDTLTALTVAGYLNSVNLQGYPVSPGDEIHIRYNASVSDLNSGSLVVCSVSVSNGVISLVPDLSEGNVVLPTIASHIATYVDTTGKLTEDPATAISGGNIQAGLSGTAGALSSFPATASKGSLKVVAVANTGNTVTTISNVSMGQTTTVSIPDPAGATANFVVAPSALVSGNLVKASGTAGLLVDQGVAMKSVYAAAFAGGSATFTVTDAFCTSTSVVTGNWATQTNPASVYKITPGNGSFVVTSSADTGVSTFSYVILK